MASAVNWPPSRRGGRSPRANTSIGQNSAQYVPRFLSLGLLRIDCKQKLKDTFWILSRRVLFESEIHLPNEEVLKLKVGAELKFGNFFGKDRRKKLVGQVVPWWRAKPGFILEPWYTDTRTNNYTRTVCLWRWRAVYMRTVQSCHSENLICRTIEWWCRAIKKCLLGCQFGRGLCLECVSSPFVLADRLF